MATAVSEIGQQFLDALDPRAREWFTPTATAGVALRRAVAKGWTPAALARECSRDLATAANVGAVVTTRLEACIGKTPPTKGLDRAAQPLPWCGECSDPAARWRLDTDAAERCECWTNLKGNR